MRKFLPVAFAIILLSTVSSAQNICEEELDGQNCTSIMVGKLASTDGSVITSHTCDGKYRTWAYMEPAADHKKGEMRVILRNTMRTAFRGDTTGVRYAGEIPEVKHTYAYLNTAYPCFNEKQVGIGETTFGGPDTLRNEKGLFTIEELQRVALQRCDNARDAIRTMGTLSEKYGYSDAGECLTVADKNEVWQFEILGNGRTETGAVWAAQRVPDDEIGISANIPRIGRLNRGDKDYFMCSDNIEAVALKYGLWDGNGDFVFWKAFNSSYGQGRNFREREFYILNALAPSLGLTYDMDELPFSIRPDSKVDVRRVMELLRSNYDGEEFDNCTRILIDSAKVSPLANPWMTSTMQKTLNFLAPGTVGTYRTVSVAWCSYSHVTQLRSWLPDDIGGICWLSVDNPGQSPHIPVFCGNSTIPEPFWRCGQNNYWPDCALWQFRRANKMATLGWQSTKEGFMKTLNEVEDAAFEGLPQLEAAPRKDRTVLLDKYTADAYDRAAAAWDGLESSYWIKFGLGF